MIWEGTALLLGKGQIFNLEQKVVTMNSVAITDLDPLAP